VQKLMSCLVNELLGQDNIRQQLRQIRQQGAPQDAVLTLIDNLCWPSLSDDLKWALLDTNENSLNNAQQALFNALSSKNIGDKRAKTGQHGVVAKLLGAKVDELLGQDNIRQQLRQIRQQGAPQDAVLTLIDNLSCLVKTISANNCGKFVSKERLKMLF